MSLWPSVKSWRRPWEQFECRFDRKAPACIPGPRPSFRPEVWTFEDRVLLATWQEIGPAPQLNGATRRARIAPGSQRVSRLSFRFGIIFLKMPVLCLQSSQAIYILNSRPNPAVAKGVPAGSTPVSNLREQPGVPPNGEGLACRSNRQKSSPTRRIQGRRKR